MITKQRKILFTMIITALFIALSFAGSYVKVYLGPVTTHLGNFVAIIASLLCGPFIGGISGAIGMMLSDLFSAYNTPDYLIRTLVVKFLMGFIAGYIFRKLLKKKPQIDYYYLGLEALFYVVFITFLSLYIFKGESIDLGSKTLTISPYALYSTLGMGLVLRIIQFFSNKLKPIQKYVLFAVAIATLVNIVGEFALKIPLRMIFKDQTFNQALVYATTSLPGAIFTGVITIIMITAMFVPVYYATKKVNVLSTINDDIQEITTWELKKEIKEEKEDNKETITE